MIKNIFGLLLISGAFVTLCTLGFWQLERAEWKKEIITQLENEYSKDPMDFPLSREDLNQTTIQYGHITGRADFTKALLFGPKSQDSRIGYDVLLPFKLENGGTVLTVLGWIKGEKREEISIPDDKGLLTLTGLSHAPDWNRFTSNNSPENNIWTKMDIDEISTALKLENVAPVIFYTHNSSKNFETIIMKDSKWFPRDKHIQYATFWFSMAGILLLFLVSYFMKTRKAKTT